MSGSYAIRTIGVTKAYGEKRALDAVDLTVDEGSIFGFLGPNGAARRRRCDGHGLARPTSGT